MICSSSSSSSNTMHNDTLDDNLADVATVEQKAYEVVSLIQQSVEILRSAFANKNHPSSRSRKTASLQTATNKHKQQHKNNGSSHQQQQSQSSVKDGTTTTPNLYDEFDTVRHKVRALRCIHDDEEKTCCYSDDTDDDRQQETHSSLVDPRTTMVHNVLWPLMAALAECYAILDQIPSSQPPTTSSTSRKNGKNKPLPPPGLLSIQNYTDIAVLVEFCVCTSIVPLLSQHVCPQSRAQHGLPKSLAGRIPPASLVWGSNQIQTRQHQIQQSSRSSKIWRRRNVISEAIVELRTSVALIGNLVTLDRFRPMLLPRHVVDLYAAMFQANALETKWKQATMTTTTTTTLDDEDDVRLVPMQYVSVAQRLLSSSSVVDSVTQARAFQTLLSKGTKTPLWLRQEVSTLLTNLASRDIAAIVHVFVRSAGDNMSSASLRLARALTSIPKNDDDSHHHEYYTLLCQQLLTLLDVHCTKPLQDPLDQNYQAGALTVWAVLDQLPLELAMAHLFPLLTQDLVPTAQADYGHIRSDDTASVHKAVRRVGMLLSSLPPSTSNPWIVGRLLMSPILSSSHGDASTDHGAKTTVVGQLFRIAAIESVVICRVKEDAVFTLECAIHCLVQSTFPDVGGATTQSVSGMEIAALALVYSMVPTVLDLRGFRYEMLTGNDDEDETDGFQAVSLQQQRAASTTVDDVSCAAHEIEKLCTILVENMLIPLSSGDKETTGDDAGNDFAGKGTRLLPSTLFHLLLLCYSSSIASGPISQGTKGLPLVFQSIRFHVEVTVMILLPLVCEKCSPETLLLTDDSGTGILSMIRLILNWTRSMCDDVDESGLELSARDETEAEEAPFCQSSALLIETLSLGNGDAYAAEDSVDLALDEDWGSVSSIVLTLLVTMLELGSEKRSDEEERILTSLLPTLGTLAQFRDRDPRGHKDSIILQPEMAEMAAHAMALIAGRLQLPSSLHSNVVESTELSRREILFAIVADAEKDLQSEQPPLRARGVAALSRISRSFLQEKEERLRQRPLVEIIDESGETCGGSDDDERSLNAVLAEIVRVSIIALGDAESYVFLAAIQSIVSAADVSPHDVIPMIAHGICYGVISFSGSGADEESRQTEVDLSPEQRIKLAEALLFTIRRRGKAIYQFVPLLMNLFLYGKVDIVGGDLSSGSDAEIQERTHLYFVQDENVLESEDESVDRSIEQMDLRAKTGGPIFQPEENATVRAACISVLSELISSCYPSVISSYCGSLIYFATNTLNLEASRPIRRATALLCYELYASVLREQDEETFHNRDDSVDASLSVAVEMVSSNEEAMYLALKRCANGSEMEGSTIQPRNSARRRLYDPATAERCKEALHARDEVDRSGVFAAASLGAMSNKDGRLDHVSDLIRARLAEGGRIGGHDRVKLKLDHVNLELG